MYDNNLNILIKLNHMPSSMAQRYDKKYPMLIIIEF